MKRSLTLAAVVSISCVLPSGFWIPQAAVAGLGPQNVLVVVNDASWTSKAVANEYVQLRKIPPANVLYLENVPVTHQITIEEFRRSILKPIVLAMAEREIEPRIECIAYSTDFPWKIDLRGDIPDGTDVPQQLTPYGSLTGMTYLLDLVFHEDVNYLQINSNSYARRREGTAESISFDETEQRVLQSAFASLQAEEWEQAAKLFEALLESRPRSPFLLYNRAVCLIRLRHTDAALDALEQAVENGWMPDRRLAREDEYFAALKSDSRYQAIMKKTRSQVFDVEQAEAFSHVRSYVVPFREEPVRYLMAVMLGVTAGRGNSVAEIRNALRRSAGADFSYPPATFYFARNENIRSTTREPYFAAAVAQIKQARRHAEIVDGILPRARRDVGGLMAGTAGFDWSQSQSALQPGAICEHLTSFGAMFQHTASQTPISEWIRQGAAGTSGTVHEPYAIGAKFPTAFLHVHYARGFSLAESFYLSVAGPYQLLILGDPLCQPWAFQPDFSLDFPDNPTLTDAIPLEPESQDRILRYSFLVDGQEFSSPLSGVRDLLPIERYADGSHTLSVIAVADSPQRTQRTRHYPFRINRFGKHAELRFESGASENPCRYDSIFSVSARCESAERIEIKHNSRVLGTIAGESGTLTIPADVPGIGSLQLHAIAFGADWSARSEPLSVNVAPPAMRTGSVNSPASTPGLKLSFGTRTTIVESLDKANWLTEAGVGSEQSFLLTGTYTADRDDLYQLEVEGNLDCQISINGENVPLPPLDRAFRSVPLSLAKGGHQFEIRGTATEHPRLEIRFGNQGRRPLDQQRFSH